MQFTGWTDDDLRRFILDGEEQIEQLKDSIDMAKETLDARRETTLAEKLRRSEAYLQATLEWLAAHDYTIASDVPIEELNGMTYWAIIPPRKGEEFVWFHRYFGQRDEALLRSAVALLGDLSEWYPKLANRA